MVHVDEVFTRQDLVPKFCQNPSTNKMAFGRSAAKRRASHPSKPSSNVRMEVGDAMVGYEQLLITLVKSKENNRVGVGLAKDSKKGLKVAGMAEKGLAATQLVRGDRVLSINGEACESESKVRFASSSLPGRPVLAFVPVLTLCS